MGVGHVTPEPVIDALNLINYPTFLGDHSGVSYQQIAETILTGAAASIDFTNIPQTYRSLIVDFIGRSDTVANEIGFYLRFDGDSGTNYDYEIVYSYGATAS